MHSRHDAEDIVQECYRRLLSRAGHYNLPRDGTKLLFKSITNACINHVQRRPAEVSDHAVEGRVASLEAINGERPEARLMHQELEHAVREALAELPVNQRAVVELSSLGHPLVDVAEMLDLSQTNTRVLLHRARQTLATKLRLFREEQTR